MRDYDKCRSEREDVRKKEGERDECDDYLKFVKEQRGGGRPKERETRNIREREG